MNRILITLMLACVALFPYSEIPEYSYIFFLIFVMVLSWTIVLSKRKALLNKAFIVPLLFFLLLQLIVLFQGLIRYDFNFGNTIVDIVQRILVIVIFMIFISTFEINKITKIFNSMLLVFFIIGFCSLIMFYLTGGRIFNENSIGFFLLPYMGLKIVKCEKKISKIILYLIGLLLLILTNGRASLLAFLLTPLWIVIIKYHWGRVLFPAMFLISSIIFPFVLTDVLLGLDEFSTGRGSLQNAYISYLKQDVISFFFGTGEFILDLDLLLGLGPHHSWIGLMFTYGLFGLIANILFILYCLRKKEIIQSERHYLLIVLYMFTIQNFEIINLGGISYMSLLFLSCLLILKKSY